VFPSGDLDNLSRFVQAYAKLPSYEPPILLGLGVGASLAVDALQQAPANGFAGAIVFDYCGASGLRARLCPRNGSEAAPEPTQTLVRMRSTQSTCPPGTPAAYAEPGADVGSFRAAFTTLAASAQARAITAPTSMSDLPIIEVDANAQGVPDTFGVFLSGDGGWAGFDEKLSALLAERGLPIVGLDSLRYFWTERTPESTAADLDRVIRRYQTTWKRRRVALIGFSQGADVLPFILNRLPVTTRSSIVSSVAMSISFKASFEFHLSNWLGASGEQPTLPEMQRLPRAAVVYVCGTADADAICPQLDPAAFQIISLPGSHHFNDDYERLSSIVLDSLTPR
jgi:type IV secretory pathway VirJ component